MEPMSRAPTFRAPEGIYTCFDWSNPLYNKSAVQYGADPALAAGNPLEAMMQSRVALRGEVPRLSGTVLRPPGPMDSAASILTVPEPIANQGIEADTLRLAAVGPGATTSTPGAALRSVRPKQSLKNATNTLLSRVQIYQDLSRAFSTLNKSEPLCITMFSAGKSVFWLTQLQNKIRDPAIRLLFNHSPLCHDINQYTRQPDRLDVAIGFNSGDILWVDPIAQRFARINKDGCSTKSAVRQITWLPGSDTILFSTHENGCVYIWDVERDDSSELIEVPAPPSSWDARRSILADRPPGRAETPSSMSWRSSRAKDSTSTNPVRHWRVSRRALTDLQFSPNAKQVAIACDDGMLRIVDVDSETYVEAGGQDDLISIFAPQQRRIVARGMGHNSFVSSVVFDPWNFRGDESMRILSVGEDGKLCLWDFSAASLTRPRATRSSSRPRSAGQPHMSPPGTGRSSMSSMRSPLASAQNDVHVSAAPRAEVPLVNPLTAVPMHGTVLSDVRVASNHLVLLHVDGTLDVYMRPDPHSRPSLQFADVPSGHSIRPSSQSEHEGLPESKSTRTGLSRLGLPRRWNGNSTSY